MRPKHIIMGGVIGILHSTIVVLLALYFGLGMSELGAWYWQNLIAQPGYSVAKYLETIGITYAGHAFYLTNIVFYWLLGSAIIHFTTRKSRRGE